MKLSYSNNSMIPDGINTKTLHFEKVNESHVGLPVLGLLENPKSKYGTSYSLVSSRDGKYIGINIPAWLGSEIKADFEESEQSVSEFFNAVIESVTEIPTDKGNPTKGVTFGYAK